MGDNDLATVAVVMDTSRLACRIGSWVRRLFGEEAMTDHWERTARVLEEALELAQAEGLTAADVQRMLDRTYSRPVGEPSQEAAGLMVTLLAWAEATGTDLATVTLAEVERIEQPEVMARIQLKQAEKAAAGTGRGYPVPGGESKDLLGRFAADKGVPNV